MKTRKKRIKSKRKQKLIVLAILLFIVSVVAFFAFYKSSPRKKIPAEEYYVISEDDIEPFGLTYANGTALKLYSLTFNLTAVRGDAHNIVISTGVYLEPVLIEEIKQGEFKTVALTFSPLYLSTLEEKGFPVEISISSTEAKGKITVYIAPDMVPPAP